jgi:Uma2 family endonuclease
MDIDNADILVRHLVPRRRLTVAEYRRLGEVGILGEDDRVELLEGQLVEMSSIGPRHALAVDALTYALVVAVGDRAAVRVQNPVTLDDFSEPQPDLVVARRPWRGYPGAHPGPEDILLLIEVANSSLEIDFGAKRELYAKAGVYEYWIVDLTTNMVFVHRTPVGLEYESVRKVMPSETLTAERLPEISIAAMSIFF